MNKRRDTKKLIVRHRPVNLLGMHGNTKWHEACNEVYQLVKSEQDFNLKGEPVDVKPISDRRTAFEGLVMKYIRYVKSFNMLCDCYKWLVHPQKRTLLRRCIEAVAGRICEIKYEMINLEKCLFNYFDDILIELSLTPSDLKLQLPKYMLAERFRILQMRERLLALMIERIKSMENPLLDDVICQMPQSCRSSTALAELYKEGISSKLPEPPPLDDQSKTVKETQKSSGHIGYFVQNLVDQFNTNARLRSKILLIQKKWRFWLNQQHVNKLKEDEEIALGLRWPRVQTYVDAREEADYIKREAMYREREQEFKISKTIEHERFMAAHGHNIAWELKYNITQWLLELRDLQGSFPDYPDEEEGGCEKLFAMKTTEQVEEEISELLNPTQGPQQREVKKDRGKAVAATETIGWRPAPTATVPTLIEALEEYNSYWYLKEEMDNIEQKFDRQLMLEKVRDEAGKQIRLQVDDLMRYELDKLRCGIELIEMDNKAKSNRNSKAAEKNKELVTKDPLASKTVEELYGELVLHGIVTPVQNVKLDDVLAEHSFGEFGQEEKMPTVDDIKSILTHLVIFPLSARSLHTVLPLTNRVMFAGPSGVGKTMMVHALCRETGANLFNLSPRVLAGKYEGQQQQEYLMNALLKVGKSLEPTIFTIDGCETMFTKTHPGLPPGQEDRGQRWVSVFSKMMDKMKKGDRMFLIGETKDPFACNNRAMFDMFKNVILFQRPDYGSRVVLWRTLLAKKPIKRCSVTLSPSTLAKFSEGYSVQEIKQAIDETLTDRRLASCKTITNVEFLMTLTLDINSDPLYEDDVAKWTAWFWSTPLMRRRRQLLDQERIARQLLETNTKRADYPFLPEPQSQSPEFANNLNKVFHNVEMGQKLTHDDSGIPVPLDNILDPVVALPSGNKSQNAEPDCAAGSSLSELDLCLSPAQAAMFDSWSKQHGGRRKRQESVNGFTLWNNGVIPYVFNSTFSPAERDAILGAMSEWQKSTCIRFRQAAEGDRDIVVFKDGIRCSTNIGRIGNEQIVTLADNCRTKRILIHELGHVIGLIHEHQRHDRDKYVKVIYENVRNISQERYQFSKLLTESLTERTVNYDYTSIMHYGRNYFAKSPELTTLQPIDNQYLDIIGRAEGPSFSDSETVNRLYRCSASCPPSLRCGDSCFMDSRCVCRCRANTDHTFPNDLSLHRNNLVDSTCEFFARRGDCAGSMEDTIGRLCFQYCRLYQPPAATSTQSPTSFTKPQAKLVTALWSSDPNLQPLEQQNNSRNHSVFTNVQNRSLAGSLLPVNTRLSTWPRHHTRRVQQSQRYSSHSSVPLATFPQVMHRNTSSLFRNRNVRRQQLKMQNITHDVSLHQRKSLNNSTKTRPRNRTHAQIGTIKGQQKVRPDNRPLRRFLAMNTTRVPAVRLESLSHPNHISRRVIQYGTHSMSRLSNSQQEHHREIQQRSSSHRQSIEAPYNINSFMEFLIARQPSISQENAGTKNGNKDINVHKSGRADILTRNFAINCQSSDCNPNPWKRTNQLSKNNVSTTGETDKLNRHLVLTDLIGPEFGLTLNHRPSNIDIKTDTVLTSDHSMQASSPYMIKNDITSQSLENRDSLPRYSMEPGFSVAWGTPLQDLTVSSSGQTVENHEPLHISQSIDSFVTNAELVP